jgi:hypothetical protein
VVKVLCCRKRGISGQVEAAKRGESVVDSVSFANKELARKARSPARMTFATGCWALPGLPLVLLTAWAGFSHQRHLSLFAVAWMAYVPGYVAATPLGERLTLLARRRPGLTAAGWGLLGLAASTAWALAHPWHVAVPGRMTAQSKTQYPVGAVDYLSRMGFTGRLMTHYNDGAYVSWKLHPQVKVAMDGRYEVAYPHAVVDDVSRLYAARSGWQALLDKYPSDAVLVRGVHALSAALSAVPAWRRVYRDDAYEIYAHPDLVLPPEDRRGQELEASFP